MFSLFNSYGLVKMLNIATLNVYLPPPLSVKTCPGLEQYAIKKFAEAFEAVPRALAENSGVKANELISKLYAEHHKGGKNMGFDIEVRV